MAVLRVENYDKDGKRLEPENVTLTFSLLDLFGKVIEQNSQNMISLIQEYKSGDDNDIYINSTCRDNCRYAYNYNF